VCPHCLAAPEPLSADYFCASCRTPFRNSYPLDREGRCALCRNGMRGFDAAYSYGAYEGVLRDLIHLYKYSRIQTLARPLAGLLVGALPRDEKFDVVTPVPLHWRRQWQRGFNQSELLAREIARRCGIPLRKVLRRARPTAAQASLSNADRRHNVAAAFVCRGSAFGRHQVARKHILLIDDVMTTGSTAASCTLALKRGGAARVTLLTIARVDRRMDGWRMQTSQSTPGRVS